MNFELSIWIGLIIFFIFTELVANNLVGVWFAIGAIFALILSALGYSIIIQFSTFLIISLILLISTRKMVTKLKKPSDYKTNTDAIIGKDAKVLVAIEPFKPGVVKVDALEWSAISESDTKYNVGDIVEIIGVKGVKVILK